MESWSFLPPPQPLIFLSLVYSPSTHFTPLPFASLPDSPWTTAASCSRRAPSFFFFSPSPICFVTGRRPPLILLPLHLLRYRTPPGRQPLLVLAEPLLFFFSPSPTCFVTGRRPLLVTGRRPLLVLAQPRSTTDTIDSSSSTTSLLWRLLVVACCCSCSDPSCEHFFRKHVQFKLISILSATD
ncbi:hypothetical protein WN943_029522 [Citrus x changshan-huyou]